MAGIAFFDVDGTLVPGTSSSQQLASLLGHHLEVREAEARYSAGLFDSVDVSIIDAAGWSGWSTAAVRGYLDALPLVDGIADVVMWCRLNSLEPVLATLAWAPVGEYLCERYGFSRTCGPGLAVAEGRYTGEMTRHFDELDKRDFAVSVAAELGLSMKQCAAVGDGWSDVPMFQEVGFALAFNATPAVQEIADASAEGDDLRVILPLLQQWLRA